MLRRLIRHLPDFLVKFFARPYVAGDSLEQGLEVTRRLLAGRRVLTTLDLLSEGITTDAAVEGVRAMYRQMIESCATFENPAERPTVSLKPSSFTTTPLDRFPDATPVGSAEAIRECVALAQERSVALSIDMEDHHWTQWTLDLANELWAEGVRHVGVVLQTRLHRTEQDIANLPQGMRVRLVIGIYNEPAEIAIRDKKEMKERMLRAAKTLLERGHYVEFATHDMACIKRFLQDVVPAVGVAPDRFEVQMLYGVPMQAFQDRILQGAFGPAARVRLYVPFATSWKHALAYCRRRLHENPSMAMAVGRNLGRVVTGRR